MVSAEETVGDGYMTLKMMRCLIGSQWRDSRTGDVFPARSVCDNSGYCILNKLQSSSVTSWKAQVERVVIIKFALN